MCGSLLSPKAEHCLIVGQKFKCFEFRKNGESIDPDLEELQKRRPCVGLCYLLKKKMDLLAEEAGTQS